MENKHETSVLSNHSLAPLVNGDVKSNGRRDTIISIQHRRTRSPPDGGWGWVVCLASFYCNGVVFGILNSFGVIYVFLKDKFDETHSNAAFVTSWVGSIAVGMTFLMSPVSSIFTDKLGIRKTVFLGGMISATGMLFSSFVEMLELLYLTYGIIMGFGASLIYSPSLVILGHYFDKRMGLVNGIVTTGSSVFTVLISFGLEYSFENFGVSLTMQLLAILLSLTMLCAIVFKPLIVFHSANEPRKKVEIGISSPNAIKIKHKQSKLHFIKRIFNSKVWKNRKYIIWVIATPAALFGYFVPFVHLVKYVTLVYPDSNSTVVIMCMGAASGVGRLVFGWLADLPCINRLHLQQLSFVMIGISTMLFVSFTSYPFIIALSLIIGLFDGCFISLLGPIAFDLVGAKNASQAIGFLLGLCSIPLTVGPPIAGAIFDHTKSYFIAFIVAGIPPMVSAIMLFWIHRVQPNFPAMSVENIVEGNFKVDVPLENENHLTNGNVYMNGHTDENSSKVFANTDLTKLKYMDDEIGDSNVSTAKVNILVKVS